MNHIVLQDVGTLFICLLALSGFYARYKSCMYSKEASAAIFTYLLTSVPIRLLAAHGELSQIDARVLNGLLAGVFLVIVVQNIWTAEILKKTENSIREKLPQ